ncbi:hypothetical protein HJD18_07230 [Thermoleophilia bacterium SCSIO 60948]|nr:hypothetical protein HJD18_07230 [Thermoleophilia bacterium SCSIO 60948]
MDVSRLSQGLKIAGVAAIVLLISTFLSWYTVSFDGGGFGPSISEGGSLWDSSGFFAVLILLCVVAVIGVVAMLANNSSTNLPVAPTAIVAGASILALILVIIRVIFIPGAGDVPDGIGVDLGRGIGLWIGLLASIAMTAGGVMAMNQSGTSFGGEADRLRGSGSGGTAA